MMMPMIAAMMTMMIRATLTMTCRATELRSTSQHVGPAGPSKLNEFLTRLGVLTRSYGWAEVDESYSTQLSGGRAHGVEGLLIISLRVRVGMNVVF